MVCAAGAAVGIAFIVRRRKRLQSKPRGGIDLLDRVVMGRGRAMSLVRVGDRVVLVGESAQGFQRLAEFDAEQRTEAHSALRRLAS